MLMVHIGADPRKTLGICIPHNTAQLAVKSGDAHNHWYEHREEHYSMAREILYTLVNAFVMVTVFVFVIFVFHGFAISQ
jgi:hypothetical protein